MARLLPIYRGKFGTPDQGYWGAYMIGQMGGRARRGGRRGAIGRYRQITTPATNQCR